MQPAFLPWLGHFNMIANSDYFVFYDNVQFERRGWQNRNYIRQENGQKKLLTLPVQNRGNFHSPIKDITVCYDSNPADTLLGILRQQYRRAPFFSDAINPLVLVLKNRPHKLVDITIPLTLAYSHYIGIDNTRFLRSSEMNMPMDKGPTGNLVEICKKLGATHYINGPAGQAYMEPHLFEEAGITLHWHHYNHPRYPQGKGDFVPYLSIIDLIAHTGKEALYYLYQSQF